MGIPSQLIGFKDEKTQSEFSKAKPRLQAFILACCCYMYFKYGIALVITDLLRDDKKSTHGWGNGVDFRTVDPSGLGQGDLTDEQGDDLVLFMKWKLPYYLKTPMPAKVKYSVRDERKPDSSKNWTAPHIHGEVNWREE